MRIFKKLSTPFGAPFDLGSLTGSNAIFLHKNKSQMQFDTVRTRVIKFWGVGEKGFEKEKNS